MTQQEKMEVVKNPGVTDGFTNETLDNEILKGEKKIGAIKNILATASKEKKKKGRQQTARRGRGMKRGMGRHNERSASEGSNVGSGRRDGSNKAKRSASESKTDRIKKKESLQKKIVITSIDDIRSGFIKKKYEDGNDDDSELEIVSEYDPVSSISDEYGGATELETDVDDEKTKINTTASASASASRSKTGKTESVGKKQGLQYETATETNR